MKCPFVLFILVLASVKSENVFYEKLDKLLNYCIEHEDDLDNGNLLGISIAKKILIKTDIRRNRMTEKLFKKIGELEDSLMKNKKFPLDFTDEGELAVSGFLY